MQALTELLPPTAVTHAVKLPFLSSTAQNLVVAKTSLLQIYEWTTILPPTSSYTDASIQPRTWQNAATAAEDRSKSKLVLVAEYSLSGTITSLASIKALNLKSGGEALLISFKDAKLSLVEWDPETYNLATISIHYYEGEDLQGSSWAPDLRHCSTFSTADPSSRCAALKFGVRHLAVLPFRQLGDDLTMGDYDPDLDEAPPQPKPTTNGPSEENQTPYGSSFVLPLSALDPNLIHPIDLAFLYEYREPTLGVLSSSKSPSASLSLERKDVLTYTAFTLDLEQRARTLLLSVAGLPSDLFKLSPLPLPVGGALLIGANEVIHVDQSGKTNAVAVNEFARQASAFPMTDQSDLALRLEGCIVEQLNPNNGDMMLILATGALVVVSFHVDGRSVSGMSLKRVPASRGGDILGAAASCAVALAQDLMFVGSEDADSLLVHCSRQRSQLSRKRSHADMLGVEDGASDDEIEDEDDLYGDNTPPRNLPREASNAPGSTDDVVFEINDRLPNITANGDPCIVQNIGHAMQAENTPATTTSQQVGQLEVALATGRDSSAGLAFLSKRIDFSSRRGLSLPNASKVWCLASRQHGSRYSETNDDDKDSSHERHDCFIITTTESEEQDATSAIYEWSSNGLEIRSGTNLDADNITLDAGVLCNGERIVQVSQSNITCLDENLKLAQIIPMIDEETDAELTITHTSFADPYLLVLRNDSSVVFWKPDDKNDQLEELDRGKDIIDRQWVAGCLYTPASSPSTPLAFLLSADGALYIFDLPDLRQPVFSVEGVNLMPPTLTPDNTTRRSPNRESITELLVADLGDPTSKIPFLILRTAQDGLVIYQPYHFPLEEANTSFTKNLRWLKVADTSLSRQQEEDKEATSNYLNGSLRYIPNLGGYGTVVVPKNPPVLIMKESTSLPKVIEVADRNIRNFSAINVDGCAHGLVATDVDGKSSLMQYPKNTRFGCVGWPMRQLHVGHQVDSIGYHAPSELYVVGINEPTGFKLPEDDDWHQEWAKEDLSFKPTGNRAKVQLFDSKNWSIISEITLEQDEIITSNKILELEVSENTHERKYLIAIGTAIIKGEDLPANGSIYIFDVIHVVPDPERPETNRGLKQIVREEVKGAVTALSEIGTEGFLLAAQGQKCMVRGLKEDSSLLPVAFLDVQCHVTVLRNVEGTGLALIGDAIKGVWLFGYSSEPYRMRLFGKTRSAMDVVTAEFLPHEKQLFILAADADCNIHVLEFNPEDPKSLSGQRLLNRSVFHAGHFPTSMTLLPRSLSPQDASEADTDVDMDSAEPSSAAQSILLTTQSGSVSLVTPLREETYRRLGALQTHLTAIIEHPCGLNPRAYRAVESEGFGSRGILDGQVLKRWHMLSTQRKAEACARVGSDVWEINGDLEMIAGLNAL